MRREANFASEVSIALKNDHPHVARVEDVYESARRIHLASQPGSSGVGAGGAELRFGP